MSSVPVSRLRTSVRRCAVLELQTAAASLCAPAPNAVEGRLRDGPFTQLIVTKAAWLAELLCCASSARRYGEVFRGDPTFEEKA